MTFNSQTLAGTAGGTLLSMLPNINSADLVRTVLLAAVGALVSFFLTLLLKLLIRKFRK